MSDVGTTTTGLDLRAAPGTGSTAREMFAPGTTDIVSGWLRHDGEAQAVPLAPALRRQPQLGAGADAKTAARIWNTYGGLLQTLAARLEVEPEVGVAVLAVESGGTAFRDGRMVIRFENHVFFDRWGQQHPDEFARHFRFRTPQRWAGHEFRPDPGEPWRTFHGSQPAEWEVFTFAQALDRVAARRSISMGLAQIMGFNAANLGYDGVDGMFDAFSDPRGGERAQVVALFDFVKGPTTTSEMVDALRDHAWLAFARRYNGAGQAAEYANRLAASHAAAHSLLAA